MRALPIMRELGAPVVFDATHSVQRPGAQGTRPAATREFVAGARARRGGGGRRRPVLETHPDPDAAPSDGPNMIPIRQIEDAGFLVAFDALAKKQPTKT